MTRAWSMKITRSATWRRADLVRHRHHGHALLSNLFLHREDLAYELGFKAMVGLSNIINSGPIASARAMAWTWDWITHRRNESLPTPRCLATTAAAAVSEEHSTWWSLTSRTTLALKFIDLLRHGAHPPELKQGRHQPEALQFITGEDSTEVANPPSTRIGNRQAQNRVRGRLANLGHPPFPVPTGSRLAPRSAPAVPWSTHPGSRSGRVPHTLPPRQCRAPYLGGARH